MKIEKYIGKNYKEKNMKKPILTCLVLMAISICLFVSCNAETAVPTEGLAYIRFGENTRGFTASYDTEKYSNLYWFYTAKKSTTDGLTGDTGDYMAAVKTETTTNGSPTTTIKKGIVLDKDKSLGPFSQGTWTFTLKAYKNVEYSETDSYAKTTVLYDNGKSSMTVWLSENDLVYKTPENAEGITGIKLLPGQTKVINTLTTSVESVGEKGKVMFDGATFVYDTKGKVAPTVTLVATRITTSTDTKAKTYTFKSGTVSNNEIQLNLTSSDNKNWAISIPSNDTYAGGKAELEPGTYKCVVSAGDTSGTKFALGLVDGVPVYELTFNFAVYGSATTKIKGSINETPYSFIDFDVEETVIADVDLSTLKSEDGLQISNNVTLDFSKTDLSDSTTDGSSTSYELKVSESKTSKNESAFLVKDTSTASTASEAPVVKAYTLELTKTTTTSAGSSSEKVTTFGEDKKVTASLNVGAGLNKNKNYPYSGSDSDSSNDLSITVHYQGSGKEQPTVKSYNKDTGILVMETSHFSEFIVIDTTKVPVTVEKSNGSIVYFDTIKSAFDSDKVAAGDTLTLLNTAKLGGVIEATKDITLDLNGKSVEKGDNYILVKTGTTLTLKGDGSAFIIGVKGTETSGSILWTAAQAKIGSDCYATLSGENGAVAKYNSETTGVELVQDITVGEDIEVKKSLVLDMNGCLLTLGEEKSFKVGDNGVVEVRDSNGKQALFIDGIRVSSSSSTGVDGKYYPTLAAAVEAASEGDTITLYGDIKSVPETIEVDKSLAINLNEKTITSDKRVFKVSKGTLTINNGTISADITTIGDYVIKVDSYRGNAGLVLEKDAIINAPKSYGIVAMENLTNDTTKQVYTANSRTATLDIYGTITSANPCIGGNGTLSTLSVTMNIYSGAKLTQDSSEKDWAENLENNDPVAVYQPNNGVLNIYGGTIKSVNGSAVEIRAGEANISGNAVLVSQAETYSKKYNENGPTVKGAAVAVSQHITTEPITVNISGGTFTVTGNGKQLALVDTLIETDSTKYSVDDKKKVKAIVASGVNMAANKIVGTKTGGSAGVDGTYYIDGESALANGIGAKAKVGEKFYLTFEEAVENALDGATVTLVDNVTLAKALELEKNITIDLNGYTIDPNGQKISNDDGTTILVKAPVTFEYGNIKGSCYNLFRVVEEKENGQSNNASLTLDSVDVDVEALSASKAIVYLYQQSNPSKLTVKNSTLKMTGPSGGTYGIGSNATGTGTYAIIDIENSTVEVESSDKDNTGLFVNVDTNVTISGSVIKGQRQAAIFRGAGNKTDTSRKIVVKNTTFEATGDGTVNEGNSSALGGKNYVDRSTTWGAGNEVALAAVVIGNANNTNSEYPRPTTVKLDNVTITTAYGYNGKQIWITQGSSDNPVTVTGFNESWSVNDDFNGAVVKSSDKKTWYVAGKSESFENAIFGTEEGNTIKLLADVDLTSYPISGKHQLLFKKNVTVDLNKKTLKSNKYGVYWEGDGLTIKNGTVKCVDDGSYALRFGYGAKNSRGVLDGDHEDAEKKEWVAAVENVECIGGINVSSHKVVIRNSEVKGHDYYALFSQNGGLITVESGTFTTNNKTSNGNTVLNTGTSTLNADETGYNGGNGAIEGQIVINGGTFGDSENSKVFMSGNLVTVQGGTFTSDPETYVDANTYKTTEDPSGTWKVTTKTN